MKSTTKRRIIFILCISIPYFIISLCYLDILRTIRNSKAEVFRFEFSNILFIVVVLAVTSKNREGRQKCVKPAGPAVVTRS